MWPYRDVKARDRGDVEEDTGKVCKQDVVGVQRMTCTARVKRSKPACE